MPIASPRSFKTAYAREVTPGVIPAIAFKTLRNIGGGGRTTTTRTEGGETHVGEVTDSVRTQITNEGTINGQMSYGALDDILPGIFLNEWASDVLKVGSADISFTFEDQYVRALKYLARAGCRITSVVLNFPLDGIPTWRVTYIGKTPVPATTSAGTGAQVAAPTNRLFSPVDSIRVADVDGTLDLKDLCITNLTIEMTRPLLVARGQGSIDPCDTDAGIFSVKGTITTHFSDTTLFEKYLADEEGTFDVTVGGAVSGNYDFRFSKWILLDGGPDESGAGGFITDTYAWQGIYDPTDSSVKVTRHPIV